ncbi:MAG TPA: HEAT repeat domain-containing protein [Syntrophales bacterium]|nr:HEAT repeat domain-containing protein [Syntrophales bacterium]HQP28581.1 HEAT repeat domain-containing protein [Syntrophales bacterium]
MSDGSALSPTVEILIAVNTALTNLRLYPPTSAMIRTTLEKLHHTLGQVLENDEEVTFAEAEQTLLVNGTPLGPKDRERPQVAAFLQLMMNVGAHNIVFSRGVGADELLAFLDILTEKPEMLAERGGLRKVLEARDLPHIRLGEKRFVAMDPDRPFPGTGGIGEESILDYLAGTAGAASLDPVRIREMAQDPEWFGRVLRAGIAQIAAGDASPPEGPFSDRLGSMMRMLGETAAPEEAESLSLLIARTVVQLDAGVIQALLSRGTESGFEERFFQHVRDLLHRNLPPAGGGRPTDPGAPSGDPALAEPSANADLPSGARAPRGRNTGIFERQVATLETMIKRHGQGEPILSVDGGPAATPVAAPAAAPKEAPAERIGLLYARGRGAEAEEIIDELFATLASERAAEREQASDNLARILPGLVSDNRYEPVVRNLEKLTAWIGKETAATTAYTKLCRQVGELGQRLIRERRFSACRAIVKTFHQIHTGALERNDTIQQLAEDVLRDLSQAELIDILFNVFQTRDRQGLDQPGQLFESDEAGRLLVRLEPAAAHFLELLGKSENAEERIRIMNLINDMGTLAVSAVLTELRQDGVWYYQRNLARLLGRIGGDIHVRALQPLLLHADRRVQKETLKSINGIGGDERGPLLTETLPQAQEALQLDIVPLLGSLRHPPAVPVLIDLLKAKPVKSSAAREELEEKICAALGAIGEESALPALTSVQRQIGFLSLRAFSPRVKAAAGRAIAEIDRKRKRGGGVGKR